MTAPKNDATHASPSSAGSHSVSSHSVSSHSVSSHSVSSHAGSANVDGSVRVRQLPERPSLENLRNQARSLQKQHRAGDAEAKLRVHGVLRDADEPLKLHDAQFVLAREHGFASWPRLVEHVEGLHGHGRVRRENGRVWIDGVARLRWGASPEPTYIAALEAAFRGSERPLDVTTLLGDSGLGFRVRWATRDGGNAWCGSGPCGEWPDEVAALNRATGYVYRWDPPAAGALNSPEHLRLIVESIERGWPILGFAAQMDMAVIYGYEDAGKRVLVSDFWANDEPALMATADTKNVRFFLERIDEPLPRVEAVRAGLALALRRWREGVVDPDPVSGGTYYYGDAGYRRWIADLERVPALSEAQRQNLFFLNGWTFSSLHQNRTQHTERYLREALRHAPEAAHEGLEAASAEYQRVRERLGRWDPSNPTFGFPKQKKLDSWTPEVIAEERALLADVHALESRAFVALERALGAFQA
jgi:hypothetical protein